MYLFMYNFVNTSYVKAYRVMSSDRLHIEEHNSCVDPIALGAYNMRKDRWLKATSHPPLQERVVCHLCKSSNYVGRE